MGVITHLFAGVPVSDLDASIDSYTRFFGRPPDVRVGNEVLWEIDEHATLFIEPNAEQAGAGRITFPVAWTRRAPRAPRCGGHRARTDRDLLERRLARLDRAGWSLGCSRAYPARERTGQEPLHVDCEEHGSRLDLAATT
jgi:catechol 2,3-dioxygenase-like lactoylglutathione lyase family enzyme